MVYTTQERENNSGGFEYSGFTFSDGKMTTVQMRKARGWERIKSLKLWFKPWITEAQEFEPDNIEEAN